LRCESAARLALPFAAPPFNGCTAFRRPPNLQAKDESMKIKTKHWRNALVAVAAVAALAAGVRVIAHPGNEAQAAHPMGMGMQHGMGMGMGMGMGGMGMMSGAMGSDPAAAADLGLVHQMLAGHDSIKRSVTRLPDGIRTVTESDDPQVAQTLKAHVASMEARLRDGRVFNLFSSTLPVLFQNQDKIATRVESTERGVTVTQTSSDPAVVAALQAHADEVSELARDGMVAMMRGMHGATAMSGGRHMRHGMD
jgi:hypothetical protein